MDDLYKDIDIKNLVNLSTNSNINLLDKNKNKVKVKVKVKILEENENTLKLSNLTKLNNNIDINKINNKKYIECYSN